MTIPRELQGPCGDHPSDRNQELHQMACERSCTAADHTAGVKMRYNKQPTEYDNPLPRREDQRQ
eukprot:6019884-Amphidinium_carterae.1